MSIHISPVLDDKKSVFRLDVGKEKKTVVSMKYDVSQSPKQLTLSDIKITRSPVEHPLQMALCVMLHHMENNGLIFSNTIVTVMEKRTTLQKPSPHKPLTFTLLKYFMEIGFSVVMEEKEMVQVNNEQIKHKQWIVLKGTVGHILNRCGAEEIKVPVKDKSMTRLPSRRSVNPLDRPARYEPLMLTQPKRKGVMDDDDEDAPSKKQQKTSGGDAKDVKSGAGAGAGAGAGTASGGSGGAAAASVPLQPHQQHAKEAFKWMGFDIGAVSNEGITKIIAQGLIPLQMKVYTGYDLKKPLSFFAHSQYDITAILYTISGRNPPPKSGRFNITSHELIPRLSSQTRVLKKDVSVEDFTVPVLKKISRSLSDETEMFMILEDSDTRDIPKMAEDELFVFYEKGAGTVPVGYIKSYSVSDDQKTHETGLIVDVITVSAPFIASVCLTEGLNVHKAVQDMMTEMLDVFIKWTIENGYNFISISVWSSDGHTVQYTPSIEELVSTNPYYNKAYQKKPITSFLLMGWSKPGVGTGASSSTTTSDLKHNTGAPPARPLKEQLKTLEQYQSDMYGDGKHQWVAYNSSDKQTISTLGQHVVFDPSSLRVLKKEQLTTLAKLTGVWDSSLDKSKSDTVYDDLFATKVKTGKLPELMDPSSLAKELSGAVDTQTRKWMLIHQLRNAPSKDDCDLIDSYYKADTSLEQEKHRRRWYVPFFKGEISFSRIKKSDDMHESVLPTGVKAEQRHTDYLMAIHGIVGYPQLEAACLSKNELIVRIPTLLNKPEQRLPSLKQLSVTKLTREAQMVIGFQVRNLIHVLHALGWTHNHLTPSSIRVDATDHLSVYVDEVQWVTPVIKKGMVWDMSVSIGNDPYAFDYLSAMKTFDELKMPHASEMIPTVHPWPTESTLPPSLSQYYQTGLSSWNDILATRLKMIMIS